MDLYTYRNIKIYLLLILWLSLSARGLFAQDQAPFRFPENFSSENYLAHTIAFKLKATDKNFFQKAYTQQAQQVNPLLLEKLQAKEPVPLFSSRDFAIAARGNSSLPERTRRLSLIYTVEIDSTQDLEEAITLLRQDPSVEYAEPIYTNHQPMVYATGRPNDPLTDESVQYHLTNIRAFDAWEIEKGDPSVVIGIIDNGCNINLRDLRDNYQSPVFKTSSSDLLNDISGFFANNPVDSDSNVLGGEHGNIVALCSSAVPNNGEGTAGTGYHCRFLPVKVAADENLNNYIDGYAGILYAAWQGAKVINLSWGRTGAPSALDRDILASVFYDYDAVLVAAAGNDNDQEFFYPASYDEVVLSVAATKADDAKASFSTYNQKVDLSAPGENLILDAGEDHSGTSFAAPLVAGTAALLRVHYPQLNAEQVMARLKTTTDPIDDLPANRAFEGKMGTGRLNMYRALTDPFKAVSLEDYYFQRETATTEIYHGMQSQMVVSLKNHLDTLDHLVISLRCSSPYVQLLDTLSVLGTISSQVAMDNTSDPFEIRVQEDVPANTVAWFRLHYQDGAYEYEEKFSVLLNPAYSHINQLKMALSDDGSLATYDNTYEALTGLTYQGNRFLEEAGLLVGWQDEAGQIRVSDAARGDLNLVDQDFFTASSFAAFQEGHFWGTAALMNDIRNNNQRIGLDIQQRTFAWNEPDLKNVIIVEYTLENKGILEEVLEHVHVGLFADWNLFNLDRNRAIWDEQTQTALVFEPRGVSNIITGITLLTDRPDMRQKAPISSQHYAFDPHADINLQDGFDTEEKFQVLSGQVRRDQAGMQGNGADVAHLVANRIDRLAIGEKRRVAFAFVVGSGEKNFQNFVSAAKERYRQIRTGPLPVLNDLVACEGREVVIRPENGQRFNFYEEPPTSDSILPIHTGATLRLNHLRYDRVFYISNADSLYESDYGRLEVRLEKPESAFEISQEKSPLAVNSRIILYPIDQELSAYHWQISHEDSTSNQAFRFVSGTDESTQVPEVEFLRPGLFTVDLAVQTAQGCVAYSSQTLEVFQDITTAEPVFPASALQLYPNPGQHLIQIETPLPLEVSDWRLWDSYGKALTEYSLQKISDQSFILDLEKLPLGIYLLRCDHPAFSITRKIVKAP